MVRRIVGNEHGVAGIEYADVVEPVVEHGIGSTHERRHADSFDHVAVTARPRRLAYQPLLVTHENLGAGWKPAPHATVAAGPAFAAHPHSDHSTTPARFRRALQGRPGRTPCPQLLCHLKVGRGPTGPWPAPSHLRFHRD